MEKIVSPEEEAMKKLMEMFGEQGFKPDALRSMLIANSYDLDATVELVMQMNEESAQPPATSQPDVQRREQVFVENSEKTEEAYRSVFDESPQPGSSEERATSKSSENSTPIA